MLFYRDSSSSGGPSAPTRTPRPLQGPIGDDEARHLTWMLKSFVMGITLLGLSYWLVQIAGVQYLATLTSATILSFLLLYVVLCVTQRTRRHIQRGGATDHTESERRVSATSNVRSEPQTPTSERAFDEYTPYKNILRGCSPPPSYEEAMRAMGIDLETLVALQYSPQAPTTSSYPTQVPDYFDQPMVTVVPTTSQSVSMPQASMSTQLLNYNNQSASVILSTSSQDMSVPEAPLSTQQLPHYHDQAVITIVPAILSTSSQDMPLPETPMSTQQLPHYSDQSVITAAPAVLSTSSQDMSVPEGPMSTQQLPHYHDQAVITIAPASSPTSPQDASAADDSRTTTSTSQVTSSSPLPAVVDNQFGTGVS